MNRRGFLRALGLGAAGFALDPERVLWVPGRVTTFDLGRVSTSSFPPLTRAGNSFLTIEMITRETLRVLEHNLRFNGQINRMYDDDRLGRSLRAPLPVRYR